MSVDPATLEALSRLLDDDLAPGDAAALRARIEAEPEVAAAWDAMQALPAALGDLPAALPPPRLALPAPSSALAPAPVRSPRLPWAVAAGALLVAGLSLGQAALAPEHRATVQLPGAAVEVDGRAAITPRSQEPTMRPLPLAAAAAAGAGLTIAVYEGSARVIPDDGSPAVTVQAGETRDVPLSASAAPSPAPRAEAAPAPRGGTGSDTPEDLAAEVARLQAENAELRLENALVRGSLAAVQGEPVPWPPDVPEGLTAGPFEEAVARTVADVGDLDLLAVDCTEYPCLAIVQSHAGAEAGTQHAQAVPEALAGELGGDEPLGVVAMGMGTRDDAGNDISLLGFALIGPDDDHEAISPRLDYRAEGMMQGLQDELTAPQPD